MPDIRQGTLGRVTDNGLAYVTDRESGKTYCFTFDKFPNYRGESVHMLGAVPGCAVSFELDGENRVCFVSRPVKDKSSLLRNISQFFKR